MVEPLVKVLLESRMPLDLHNQAETRVFPDYSILNYSIFNFQPSFHRSCRPNRARHLLPAVLRGTVGGGYGSRGTVAEGVTIAGKYFGSVTALDTVTLSIIIVFGAAWELNRIEVRNLRVFRANVERPV